PPFAPPPAPPLAVPTAPLGMFGSAAPGLGFGKIDLDVAIPPTRSPAPVGTTTAPLPAVGTAPLQAPGTTQKLATPPPPPAPLPMPVPPVLVDVTPLTLAVETVEGFCD